MRKFLFPLLIIGAVGVPACKQAAPLVIGDPVGAWQVVGDTAPGVSAADAETVTRLRHAEFRYDGADVIVDRDTCPVSTYRSTSVRADTLLTLGYQIDPEALGFAPDENVWVTDVLCEGRGWTSVGTFLIWKDATNAFSPSDGVFYHLHRPRNGV